MTTCAICMTDWLLNVTFSCAQIQPCPGLHSPHFQWAHEVVCWLSVHRNPPRPAHLTQLLPQGHLSRAAFRSHGTRDPQQDSSFLVYGFAVSTKQKVTVLPEADPEHQPPAPVLCTEHVTSGSQDVGDCGRRTHQPLSPVAVKRSCFNHRTARPEAGVSVSHSCGVNSHPPAHGKGIHA